MEAAKTLVEARIAGKRVVVFSKSWCGYCNKAKQVLKKYVGTKDLPADEYEVIELDGRDDGDAIQNYLQKRTGARSVPRVFINGDCIGGGDETKALESKGQLLPKLTASL